MQNPIPADDMNGLDGHHSQAGFTPSSSNPEITTTDSLLAAAVRRAAWRLIPFVGLGYLINYMDRSSTAFAALQMNSQLGITHTEFGFAGSMFFIAYTLFEIPSNLALARFGARRWFARIMVTWGLAACACALVTGPKSLYVVRFLLGAFEAGYFPGVIFYLSLWFPRTYRTRMLALFAVAAPIAQCIGAPISTGLMQLHGLLGLAGWQWMFLIEGVPALLLGVACLRALTDRPSEATWMPAGERDALVSALAAEQGDTRQHALAGFTDPRVWVLSGVTFCFTIGGTGLGLWLPLILQGHDLSTMRIGLLSIIPYIIGALATLVFAHYVDRSGRPVLSLAATFVLAFLGLMIAAFFSSLGPSLVGLSLAIAAIVATRTVFYTIPPLFLTGSAAAGALALINSVGSIGGIIGPSLVGWLKDATGTFAAGLLGLGVFILAALGFTIAIGILLRRGAGEAA